MANNPLANIAGAAGGGILGGYQQYGATTTTTANYPPGGIYQPIYYPPVTPDTHIPNLVGNFRIRKVENGYLIEYAVKQGDYMREYFAADLKEAGERITAICVEFMLKGDAPK